METSGAHTFEQAPRQQVLLLDDDPASLQLMKEVLRSAGYDCIATHSAEEALACAARESRLRVIVSDICMPEMDGLMFLDRINLLRTRHTPRVLLLTAHPTLDRAIAALRLGATDFLIKPIRPRDLLSAVDRACGRAERLASADGDSSWTPESLAQQAEMLAVRLRMLTGAAPANVADAAPVPAPSAAALSPAKGASSEEAQRQLRTAQLLDSMEQLRRLRRRNRSGLEDIDDIAWELLMEVLRSAREGRQISVSGLTISVEGVSPTTALRRINELVARGHLQRIPDPTDARRDFVTLNQKTREALDDYLARAAAYLA